LNIGGGEVAPSGMIGRPGSGSMVGGWSLMRRLSRAWPTYPSKPRAAQGIRR
jgi:hypothetical protein